MTAVSQGPQSVSRFLRSYAPDTFEWESSEYVPHTRCFLWAKPIALGSFPSLTWTRSPHDDFRREGGAVSRCTSVAAHALSDGPPSSPGSESLSDMSISLSDAGSLSGRGFSILPPMNRTRATTPTSLDSRINADSDMRSLSDMSISPSSSTSYPLRPQGGFECFLSNMPNQTVWDPPPTGASLDCLPSPARDMKSGECATYENGTNDPDAVAVSRILEWTASLFVNVASSVLTYSIQPGVDDVPGSICLDSPTPRASFDGNEESFSASTREPVPDLWSSGSEKPITKIISAARKGPARTIQANPLSIVMPGAIEYDAFNPEQLTTAKPVCMWGRRLERIPKVRLAGQHEAVYCFDSRKQRQKQKGREGHSTGSGGSGGGNLHTTSVSNKIDAVGSTSKEQQQPIQIFYRARPLGTQLVRRDLPAIPVDAVKITQGQVLLQNIRPVKFNATTDGVVDFQPNMQIRTCRDDSSCSSTRRLPLTPRTNGLDQGRRHHQQMNGMAVSASLLVKRIPGRGFL